MRSAVGCLLTVFLTITSPVAGQAPLPTPLQEGKRVYITGQDVERKRIDHLAKELQKRKRFDVVGDREHGTCQ